MTERVRFTTSIGSGDWAYSPGQEVTVGESYTDTEIPAGVARAWLSSGVVKRIHNSENGAPRRRRRAQR